MIQNSPPQFGAHLLNSPAGNEKIKSELFEHGFHFLLKRVLPGVLPLEDL